MRLGGITADADLSPTRWTAAIQQAKQRGSNRLSPSPVILPRSDYKRRGNLFIDQKYDGRDAESLTEAEIHGENRQGLSASHSHDTRL